MFEWFGRVSFVPHTKVSDFAKHLKDGSIMASTCASCGFTTFPPRADCPQCRGGEFTYTEISGEGTILTYTKIEAAPAGFEDDCPFTIGVVELAMGEGRSGRLLGWFGDTICEEEIAMDMPVQVVPRMFEEEVGIKVYYSLEKPGTTWVKSNSTK
ncbi:MAG: Zn-ribbon domain-containing OB-fold protein [Planctomycetota bacterium]